MQTERIPRMKIAILTSGILPVPAVLGGAVENLIDFYLEYNDIHQLHDITVYSCNHCDTKNHPAVKSKVNHYHYIDTTSIIAKNQKTFISEKSWWQRIPSLFNRIFHRTGSPSFA